MRHWPVPAGALKAVVDEERHAPQRPERSELGRDAVYQLRVSLTDRCDMRCRYCMAEQMSFLPRSEILSLEEIACVARAFVARGVTKIRLTGGEPLVRRGATDL